MNIQYIHPADQLVMFMQRIYDKGLTTMSGGNLSIRDTQGNIWITPAGIDKGTLTRKDIICVRPDGSCEGPHKPSSELPFHESVYRMRPGSERRAARAPARARGVLHRPQAARS